MCGGGGQCGSGFKHTHHRTRSCGRAMGTRPVSSGHSFIYFVSSAHWQESITTCLLFCGRMCCSFLVCATSKVQLFFSYSGSNFDTPECVFGVHCVGGVCMCV